jgi:hypothetical protein
MLQITIPPEVETRLTEEAARLGVDAQQLAIDALRTAFPPSFDGNGENGETLYDYLAPFIGVVDGSTEPLSENTGERFTEYVLEKQRQGRL